MNPQLSFIKWVKSAHPRVYQAAIQKVQRKSALGGLGDDLTSDITFDPGTVSVADNIDYSTAGAANPSGTSASTDWSGTINAVAGAIVQVAPTLVQTDAQLKQINTNASLAQRGLPMVGNLLTGTGGSMSMSTVLLFALGIGAIALVGSKRGS